MKLGYNTNGLAFHPWETALELLAEAGYRSVAVTLDHHCLNPFASDLPGELKRMRQALETHELSSVIETGARFLLNSREKHEPTLLTGSVDGRRLRVDFLKRAIDIAAELGSDAMSFWSGVLRDPIDNIAALERLADGCREVLDHATKRNVRLAFEPEPGMLIESFDQYSRLLELVDGPLFGLTIDIGHVQCVEEGPIVPYITAWGARLFNVHIEDMRRGVHEHLMFGEGEIDFPPVISALKQIGYTGGVHVELSRHSHAAPDALRKSYEFLQPLMAE
ncbi:MAG: sugar phosphate isomerase/epimerase family protein [Planctomycetaceae bacterium]